MASVKCWDMLGQLTFLGFTTQLLALFLLDLEGLLKPEVGLLTNFTNNFTKPSNGMMALKDCALSKRHGSEATALRPPVPKRHGQRSAQLHSNLKGSGAPSTAPSMAFYKGEKAVFGV